MSRIAIVGGTGAGLLPVELVTGPAPQTKWGSASAELTVWPSDRHDMVFLPRHGVKGGIAPHAVNYRANIQLVADFKPDWVVALNAVGGISASATPGSLVIPDQLIDYSWGREPSFYTEDVKEFVDFTEPYSTNLRNKLIAAAQQVNTGCITSGTYACTQGPRLETAAEIDRLESDGCQIVGMTGMPEAALARELRLEYASLAMVVNRAAGRATADLNVEMEQYLAAATSSAAQVIEQLQKLL